MEIDGNLLKPQLDEFILNEIKCFEVLRALLIRENLNNPTVDKVIEVLSVWSSTPPIETLKKLEKL